jgi:dihydroorotate dehydrogenase (NAD+) catalytic subunit
VTDTNLEVRFGDIRLKNPVVAASGTFGYGLTYSKFYDVSVLGGFVTKGLSLAPKPGNPPPRICETSAGMLNAIGLQNIGLEKFVSKKIPVLRGVETAIIVNFFGNTVEEYAEMASRLSEIPEVAALEMNISCPNVTEGGIAFGSDVRATSKIVSACRKTAKKPLIVKLSPNVTDITEFARACEAEGADGLSVINTVIGMAIDIGKRKPVLSNVTGGLSGPAIKPIALRMVWQCYKTVKIPIFGVGGISSPEDVVEFMMAGATAVQIGSMNFVDPHIGKKIADTLPSVLERIGESHASGIIGAAHS